MYNNLEISMVQFRVDKLYEDHYQMVAEINGITFESYVVKPLDKWAETLKCELKEVETRVIKK
jgi:hypothetical protein